VLVNTFVVVIWANTDTPGFFWPLFLIAGSNSTTTGRSVTISPFYPGHAALFLRELGACPSSGLRPPGLLPVRGDLGNLDVRRLDRRYVDRLYRRYGVSLHRGYGVSLYWRYGLRWPGSGWVALDGGLGLGYLGVAEVGQRR